MTRIFPAADADRAKGITPNRFSARSLRAGAGLRILIGMFVLGVMPAASGFAQTPKPRTMLSEAFKVVTRLNGSADTSVLVGSAVGSPDTMRIEVTSRSNPLASGPATSGKIGMIVTDSGKAITYVDYDKQQYFRVRPMEMIRQAEQTGAMKMDFSQTRATVDSLGNGPVILSHPTLHFRVATGMTLTMSTMGQQQVVTLANSSDYYYATDISAELNPFASLSDADMVTMVGASNKELTEKLKAIHARLPKRTPLRASSHATVEARGETRVIDSIVDVTSISWIAADPKIFAIPSTYTAVQLPGLPGSSSGAIPPN
jgi:hypothetical protein